MPVCTGCVGSNYTQALDHLQRAEALYYKYGKPEATDDDKPFTTSENTEIVSNFTQTCFFLAQVGNTSSSHLFVCLSVFFVYILGHVHPSATHCKFVLGP